MNRMERKEESCQSERPEFSVNRAKFRTRKNPEQRSLVSPFGRFRQLRKDKNAIFEATGLGERLSG